MSEDLKQMGKTRKLLKPLMDLFADRIEKAVSNIEANFKEVLIKQSDSHEQIVSKLNKAVEDSQKENKALIVAMGETNKKELEQMRKMVSEALERPVSVKVNAPDVKPVFEVPKPQVVMQKSDTPQPGDYQPHDQGKKGLYQYSGFVRPDGAWYIQRVTKGEQRYAAGKNDYAGAWDKRDTLKYGLINEVM